MDWNEVKGQWKQLQGKARTKWGKFTDDDWTQLAGHKDQIIGKLQERYGYKKDQAEREAQEFADSLIEEPEGSKNYRR